MKRKPATGLPGKPNDQASRGCNLMIKQGSTCRELYRRFVRNELG